MLDSGDETSPSSLVNGQMYAANYTVPTPNLLSVAVLAMQTAYVDAADRTDPDIQDTVLVPLKVSRWNKAYTSGEPVLVSPPVSPLMVKKMLFGSYIL